jgi:hypothetical protein
MEKICRWCKIEAQKVLGIPGDDRIWGLCAACLRRELYLREQERLLQFHEDILELNESTRGIS